MKKTLSSLIRNASLGYMFVLLIGFRRLLTTNWNCEAFARFRQSLWVSRMVYSSTDWMQLTVSIGYFCLAVPEYMCMVAAKSGKKIFHTKSANHSLQHIIHSTHVMLWHDYVANETDSDNDNRICAKYLTWSCSFWLFFWLYSSNNLLTSSMVSIWNFSTNKQTNRKSQKNKVNRNNKTLYSKLMEKKIIFCWKISNDVGWLLIHFWFI